jgi:hypothetical protein
MLHHSHDDSSHWTVIVHKKRHALIINDAASTADPGQSGAAAAAAAAAAAGTGAGGTGSNSGCSAAIRYSACISVPILEASSFSRIAATVLLNEHIARVGQDAASHMLSFGLITCLMLRVSAQSHAHATSLLLQTDHLSISSVTGAAAAAAAAVSAASAGQSAAAAAAAAAAAGRTPLQPPSYPSTLTVTPLKPVNHQMLRLCPCGTLLA